MGSEQIRIICQQFRKALEQADNAPSYMSKFPHGWCGCTSRALGGYLASRGYSSLEYVSGYRGMQNHAWIEKNGLIIDITADQFNDCDKRIIISRDSDFHRTFSNIKSRSISPEDANQYPESWIVRVATTEKA